MHRSSYEKMVAFREKYLSGREAEKLHIYDLGSQDVNGSYCPVFAEPTWKYIGLDMEAGNNVDIILKTPYIWSEVKSNSADVLISGQAFEHIEYFWITMLEIARVLKSGGTCCIIAPSSGHEHRYPQDCWRFFRDGMVSLADSVSLEVLEASTQLNDTGYEDGSDWWHDSMLVCRKRDNGFFRNNKADLKRWLQHKTMTLGMK